MKFRDTSLTSSTLLLNTNRFYLFTLSRKPTMAESKMEFTTPNNTPNLAPILCLPTEVRTEIFSYLLQEVQSGFQDTLKKPSDAFVDSTTQLFQTPITTVCRTVRYEIIEQIYRNLFWPIAFPPSTDRWTSSYAARQVGLINAIDPYVLRCVKGIQITEMWDRCQDWWRGMPFRQSNRPRRFPISGTHVLVVYSTLLPKWLCQGQAAQAYVHQCQARTRAFASFRTYVRRLVLLRGQR